MRVFAGRRILYTRWLNNRGWLVDQVQIFAKLAPIFHDVMDNDNIEVSRELSAGDVDEWDSLSHIRLIVAVERGFHVKFQSMEISDLKNLGDLVDLLQQKLH
jgi:acyl carrier protein